MADMKPVEAFVVEDNPTDVELIVRALRKNKLVSEVHVAKDGEEALDFLFARGPYSDRAGRPLPSFMILDLRLPKVDGVEVLKSVKSDERTKNMPVIVMTGSEEERDMAESYKLGIERYIIKPKDFTRLEAALSELSIYWLLWKELP
jgi:CheY-like chemotaxis protein